MQRVRYIELVINNERKVTMIEFAVVQGSLTRSELATLLEISAYVPFLTKKKEENNDGCSCSHL